MRKRADTYNIYTSAVALPISVSDAKAHCGVTNFLQDNLIADLIWGGVKAFEKSANVCLSAQKWKVFLDKGYAQIELWKYPITGISIIQYYDSDNALQTLSTDDYFSNVDVGSSAYSPRPAVITIEDIPSTYKRDDALIITFEVGYTIIDYDVKQAILAWVFYRYENPMDSVSERISFFDNIIANSRSYGL